MIHSTGFGRKQSWFHCGNIQTTGWRNKKTHETPASWPGVPDEIWIGHSWKRVRIFTALGNLLGKKFKIKKKKINTYTKILYASLLVHMLPTTSRHIKHTMYPVLSLIYSECHPNIQTYWPPLRSSISSNMSHLFVKRKPFTVLSRTLSQRKKTIFFH